MKVRNMAKSQPRLKQPMASPPRHVIVSRIGVRHQTVVPKAVRQILQLKPGDELAYVIEDGRIALRKSARGADNPFACFDEWSGPEDSKAYAGF